MDETQFTQWAELIERRTGMVLPRERKSFLTTNLGLRMREIGCRDYQEYYEHLQSHDHGLVEWATLVDRLTVNETRFFRHPPSLRLIRDVFVPSLKAAPPPSLQAWSVGCATGQEVYTLAMVIDQALQRARLDLRFGVVGTDISAGALAKAREGVYREAQVNDVDPLLRRLYFQPHGAGRYQVVDSLRRRACFARMNILEPEYAPRGPMDIIYCQNLLIYFDRQRRSEIAERFIERLRPGGLLILGAGELLGFKHPEVTALGDPNTLAYQRRPCVNDTPRRRAQG